MPDGKAEDQDSLKQTPKNPVGRPRKEVNVEELEKLAEIHCTMNEMASVLGCCVDTLRDNLSDVIERGRDKGKESLRRAQWKAASNGNVAMMIWLGKQLLGQRDRHDLDMNAGITVVVNESHVKL